MGFVISLLVIGLSGLMGGLLCAAYGFWGLLISLPVAGVLGVGLASLQKQFEGRG